MASSTICDSREIGGERLFDQHRQPALGGGEHRVDVQVLVGAK